MWIEEAILRAIKGRCVQVLVANHTDSPKELACGTVIGQVEPFVETSHARHTVETVNEAEWWNRSVLNIDVDPDRK